MEEKIVKERIKENEVLFIKEGKYQKIKSLLCKKDDYFSYKELMQLR